MKTMILTNGSITTVDDDIFEDFQHLSFYLTPEGYAGRMAYMSNGKRTIVQLHRLVMLARNGQDCHHIDGNKLNNQRNNMQLLTRAEHTRLHSQGRDQTKANVKMGPRSGRFRGVSFHQKRCKWIAQININKKYHYLGLFITEEDAAKVWDKAAKEAWGPDCFQNFPHQEGGNPD